MYRIFLMGTLLMGYACSAQTFTKVYAPDNSLAQFENIAFTSLTPAPGGGIYACGDARSSSDQTALISRLDQDGMVVWSKQPEKSRNSRTLVALNDGSVLFFNNNIGFQDYFDASVMHLGSDGSFIEETIWGKQADQDDWYDAKKLDNGEVLAIGMSRISTALSGRLLVVKFDANGQVFWEKLFDIGLPGNFGIANFREVVPLSSGEFYVMGQSFDFSTGQAVGLLGKFSADGSFQWMKSYQYGTDGSYFQSGQVLSNGDLFVACYQTSQGVGDPKLLLLNFSSTGAINSQKAFDSDYDLAPIKVGKGNNNTLYIAAVTNGATFPVVDLDQIILEVSPQGDLQGQIGFGTSGQDYGFDAYFMGDKVFICGFTDTTADGSLRRAFVAKSAVDISCCEKPTNVIDIAAPTLPVILDIPLTSSQVPSRQNLLVTLSDFPLLSTVSCEGIAGVQLLTADTTICVGDTIQIGLKTKVPGNILWSTGQMSAEIKVSNPGAYIISLEGACGTAKDTIEVVSIGNRVDAQVIPTASGCAGTMIQLSASGGIDYFWYDAQGDLIADVENPKVTPAQSTLYRVVVADGQCRDSATVQVTVLPAPKVNAGPDATIKLGNQVRLNASGAEAYIWQPNIGLSCADCPNPIANPETDQTYVVYGTDINGCSETNTINITVRQPCPFYIPNVFKPETTDALGNGTFGVLGQIVAFESFLLRIYSRWGELVFQSENPETQWNGIFNGQNAPAGVYLYQLEMTTCDGPLKTTGNLTLIR